MFLVKKVNGFTWAVLFSALLIFSFNKSSTYGYAEEIELPEVVDRIVAKVNDEIILLSELDEALTSYADQASARNSSNENKEELMFKLRSDVLNQLVEKKLAEQQIKKLGIRVEDTEISSTIERVKQNNFFTSRT